MRIATSFAGLWIPKEPWKEAHKDWFEKYAKQLNDESIKEWIGKENYYEGVMEVAKQLLGEQPEETYNKWARKQYFESVVAYIKKHEVEANTNTIDVLRTHADTLAIISSTPEQYVLEILKETRTNEPDELATSSEEDKDNTTDAFLAYITANGKPDVYISTGKEATEEFCKRQNIRTITYESTEQLEKELRALT